MKPRVKEVIVVEGRYDRNALLQAVDATVVETGGFSVFNDPEKLAEASPAQITTALGTLIDKFTANTEPKQDIHPLLRDMYESRKQ